MPIRAFISYKRSGPILDQRVAQFHELLKSELGYIDSQSSVFLDTENMGAGDVFPEVLKERVESADVLIVLLSPTWLQSDWCRKEYTLFSAKEQAQNYTPRVLPVLWVETTQLDNPAGDAIAEALSRVNYQEFERLRHFKHDDPAYSLEMARLAKRVKKVAERSKQKANGDDDAVDANDGDLNHDYWWGKLGQPIKDYLQAKDQLCSALTDSLHTLELVDAGDELTLEKLVAAFSRLDSESLVDVLDESLYSLCKGAQAHTVRLLGTLAEMLLPLIVESDTDVTAIRQYRPCNDQPAVSVSAFGEVAVEAKMAMADDMAPVYQRSGERLRSPHDMSPDVENGLDELGQQQISDQLDVIKHNVLPTKDGRSASGVTLSNDDLENTGKSLDKMLHRRRRRSGRRAYSRYALNQSDKSGTALQRLYELLPSLRLVLLNPDVQHDEFNQYEVIAQIILASKSDDPCRKIEAKAGGITE